MQKKYTVFELYHPGLLLVYALMSPIFAMLTSHPFYIFINVCMCLFIHGFYFGAVQTGKSAAVMSICIFTVALFNFCFNTRGMHILFRIGQHPFTLESLLYGLASGGMLAAVILWFQCFNKIVSNEKFLYLFGKRLPGTALLLSMILKLFPDTRYRMKCIRYADKETVGRDAVPILHRVRKGLRQLSVLLEWTMEDSIEKADSMKARGYGEGARSCWQRYTWSRGDTALGIVMIAAIAVSLAGIISYNAELRWYPVIETGGRGGFLAVSGICYAGFLVLPLLVEMKARWSRQW